MEWNSPRIGVFSANNRTYLCFEDGADCNFCDMIIEIKKGTEIIQDNVAPEVNNATYTMCFEDRPLQADFDMNDVVLTAERLGGKKIRLTLQACGAQDNVTLHNVPGSSNFEGAEIHKLLGISEGSFANTEIGGSTCEGYSEEFEIDGTLENYLSSIYIKNEVTGHTVSMKEVGLPPSIIIVPGRFNYPKEGTSIVKAYPGFLEWAADMNASKDWYRSVEGVDRYPTIFLKK